MRVHAVSWFLRRLVVVVLVQHAKDNECRRVVWQVLDWNKAAIGFYKSLGAELATEWLTCRLHHKQILEWRPKDAGQNGSA